MRPEQRGPHDWKSASVFDLSVPYWCTACGVEVKMTLILMLGADPLYGRDGKIFLRRDAFNEHRKDCETCAPHAPGSKLCARGYLLTGKLCCETCLKRGVNADPDTSIGPQFDCTECRGLSYDPDPRLPPPVDSL